MTDAQRRKLRMSAATKLLAYFGKPQLWSYMRRGGPGDEPMAVKALCAGMCFRLHLSDLTDDERNEMERAINVALGRRSSFLSSAWVGAMVKQGYVYQFNTDREVKALWRLVWLNHLAEGGDPR